jgi:hypothetical protein
MSGENLNDLDSTVRTIADLWENARDKGIWPTVKRYDMGLYEALNALMEHVNASGPIDRSAVEAHELPREYPAELRVADLEGFLEARHRRVDALHHARKSWGGTMSEDADRHARSITTIAQAFDRFLADGTAHEVPTVADDDPAPAVDVTYQPLADMVRGIKHAPKILAAAFEWVDRAHLKNPGGPENWRNWSDDHDQALINAVLAYRGLPPLEREKS